TRSPSARASGVSRCLTAVWAGTGSRSGSTGRCRLALVAVVVVMVVNVAVAAVLVLDDRARVGRVDRRAGGGRIGIERAAGAVLDVGQRRVVGMGRQPLVDEVL